MSVFSSRLKSVYVAVILLGLVQKSLGARKFAEWFADSKQVFQPISAGTCNATLAAYNKEYDALGGAWWIDLAVGHTSSPIFPLCRAQMDCIINNLDEALKASLASGQVVLGLLPTLLAVISPSIAELALLSVHRPILSALISLGSPGVLQTRIFEYEDPAESLDLPDEYHGVTRLALALGPWSSTTSTVVSILEFILVIGSGLNVCYLAYELGTRSILSWGCTRSWPVMLWAGFPLVIHLFSAVGYRLTLDPATRVVKPPVLLHKVDSFFTRPPPASRTASSLKDTAQATKSGPLTSVTSTTTTGEIPLIPIASSDFSSADPVTATPPSSSRFWALLKREVLPCAAHPDTVINNRLPMTHPTTRIKIGIVLNCFAGFLSCMHLLYGTVVFASFNFIEVIDVIKDIATRYLASSVVCRLVILTEVAGMRGARLQIAAQHGEVEAKQKLDEGGIIKFANNVGGGLEEGGAGAGARRKPYRRHGMRL